ncbi:hypothetical protein SDC9_203841 [bioreactor metagenome]|uniref:Uncharacterized protein n=1 Tax=bioreactor metagenome TaxID=1076179 RepID=A0A645IXJ7_9ZZZZ
MARQIGERRVQTDCFAMDRSAACTRQPARAERCRSHRPAGGMPLFGTAGRYGADFALPQIDRNAFRRRVRVAAVCHGIIAAPYLLDSRVRVVYYQRRLAL